MATASREEPGRLLFIDNIRWSMIVLVICHHAAVTYSHVGGWYYLDPAKPTLSTTVVLASLETFDQAYFMGLLFLIAGYFVAPSFDRKGALSFLRDRAARLGIPTLVFMLVIHPFTVYWLLRKFDDASIPPLSSAYWHFISTGRVFSATGPMWFAVALLIFCAFYASIRCVSKTTMRAPPVPGHKQVIALIVLMGVCSFAVRIVQPIGTNILNMQLGYFSQYVILFAIGIVAYRGNWLRLIPRSFGLFWLKLALRAGVAGWFLLLATSGALHGDASKLLGGVHWQSAADAFWEAFFCSGMCLGLIVVFRDRFNRQGPFATWMSRNSFAAYVFHPPILIAVTLALKSFAAPLLVKFVIASLIAVPATFLISSGLRRGIPGARRIL